MLGRVFACPTCHHAPLLAEDSWCCNGCGAMHETLDGVPILIPGARTEDVDLRATGLTLPRYDSALLGIAAIDEALARGDRVLEVGAGLDSTTAANVVRTDAFVYGLGAVDAVADVHRLPFPDASFDFVFSLAVFEHLHSPWLAASEIARVLRPGGRVFVLCAFFQPLHGYPDHYFNATESGLRRLFANDFEIIACGPSRHCPDQESVVPLWRMRDMAHAFVSARENGPRHWRTRWRALRLHRALGTAVRQFQQLAELMIAVPDAHEHWRHIAPAVELLGVRSGDRRPEGVGGPASWPRGAR
jgi:SAM-dependent methyltransferase